MSACRTTQDDTRIQHKRNAILSLHDSQDMDKHLCKSVVLKCRKLVTLYLHLVCQAFSSGKSNIAVVAAVVARIRGVHYQQKQRYWTIRLHYSSAFHSSECFEIYSEWRNAINLFLSQLLGTIILAALTVAIPVISGYKCFSV